ncbi:MAG TPA: ATP-binding cassette domain-containing protein [Anaerolineaceae bacterium]|nr:ATP-binding cassette domain-containing protein [Anaerolineaceae bacterium]
MISISNVSKKFGLGERAVAAVDGVSLEVEPGEIFGVLGPSGAGKSTLIRCVNLLERPDSGSIRVDGQELTALSPAELRQARTRIGMIFQHFNLLNSRTVAGNVAFPLEVTGLNRAERDARVRELLEMVGLSDKALAYPSQLSGGQKQRVGIARALATQPRVLLSDEATSALDPQNTSAILDLLRDLNRRLGLTILLITHEMNVVQRICDRVAVMQAGRIVEQGTVAELVAQPDSFIARALFPPIEAAAAAAGATTAAITFLGEVTDQPVLTTLVRKFDVNVNILGGSIQSIAGRRVGQLQVELAGGQVSAALDYLRGIGLRVEVR